MSTIEKQLTVLFEDNIGNKFTVALANGFMHEIGKILKTEHPPKQKTQEAQVVPE